MKRSSHHTDGESTASAPNGLAASEISLASVRVRAIPRSQDASRISIGGAGGLEIATIPGEATNTFGQFIRGLAEQTNPGAAVMLLGLTQNSFGYIIPEEEFSYIEPSGDAGFVVPFTGYEEFVSLGPLTAPLLRSEAYIPLFDGSPEANLPEYLSACSDPASDRCLLRDIALRVEYIQREYAQRCRENGAPEEFCALLDPGADLGQACGDAGLPDEVCALLGGGTPGNPPGLGDAALAGDALLAAVAGCDMLDPSNCLLPFSANVGTVGMGARRFGLETASASPLPLFTWDRITERSLMTRSTSPRARLRR